jgi:ADP-ribosylation factor-binding protein GGA
MKIKLQPASRSDLPVYNPILAPSVITQIMLVANPKKEQIRLKYKISFSYGDVNYNEPEDIKTLPALDSLL